MTPRSQFTPLKTSNAQIIRPITLDDEASTPICSQSGDDLEVF